MATLFANKTTWRTPDGLELTGKEMRISQKSFDHLRGWKLKSFMVTTGWLGNSIRSSERLPIFHREYEYPNRSEALPPNHWIGNIDD